MVYSGDDERDEFLYRWVSRDPYVPGGDTSTLLDEGQLYVAGFNDDQIVRWRPTDDDHAADTFEWDLYLTCGNPPGP